MSHSDPWTQYEVKDSADHWAQYEVKTPLPSLDERKASAKSAFEANQPESHLGMNLQLSTLGPDLVSGLSKLGHALFSPPTAVVNGKTVPVDTGNAPTSIPGLDFLRNAMNPGAVTLAGAAGELIPSTAKAGEMFNKVASATNDVPVETAAADQIAERAKELGQRGNTLPKVIRDFVKARKPGDFMSQPVESPMTYEVARDFASKAGSLSAQESAQIAKTPMQAQVSQFAGALKDANREAAVSVGMGDLYDQAMKEYRQAKNLEAAADVVKKWGLKIAITTGLGAAGYKLFNGLWGKP